MANAAFSPDERLLALQLGFSSDSADGAQAVRLELVSVASGRLTVYSTTQAMYFTMSVLAGLLGVPLSKVKFVGGTVGGGFGGKVDGATEPITGLLAVIEGLSA